MLNISNAPLWWFPAVVALEEQKVSLSRELSTLRHTHNKVRLCSSADVTCSCIVMTSQWVGQFSHTSVMFSPAAGSHTSGTFGKEKGVWKRFASQVVLIPHSWNYWLRLQIVFHTEREEAVWAVLSCLINKSLLIFILATCAAWLPTWLCDHSAVYLFILHLEAAYHAEYTIAGYAVVVFLHWLTLYIVCTVGITCVPRMWIFHPTRSCQNPVLMKRWPCLTLQINSWRHWAACMGWEVTLSFLLFLADGWKTTFKFCPPVFGSFGNQGGESNRCGRKGVFRSVYQWNHKLHPGAQGVSWPYGCKVIKPWTQL